MYVCICNGYRDSEISEVARSGVRCAKRAYFSMGSGPRCGQCLDMAQDIIDDVHEAEPVECASSRASSSPQLSARILPASASEMPAVQGQQVSFSKS